MQRVATILASGSILLGKSPKLMILLYVVLQGQTIALNSFYTMMAFVTRKAGLDKPLKSMASLDTEEWDIDQVLENFEDMRVNAKELDILKEIQKKEDIEELEGKRLTFVSGTLAPITEFLKNIPSTSVYYFGGLLAGGGALNPADINGFRMAMEQLITGTRSLYSTLIGLYELEDSRFAYAFTLMGMLDRTPKIGIDGGWQPPPRKHQKIHAKAKLGRVLDDAGT